MKGVKKLDMSFCGLVSDAAFAHLAGVESLNMRLCKQATITNDAFQHLKGIQTLNMIGCNQATITNDAFQYLAGIQTLYMSGCGQFSDDQLFSLTGRRRG